MKARESDQAVGGRVVRGGDLRPTRVQSLADADEDGRQESLLAREVPVDGRSRHADGGAEEPAIGEQSCGLAEQRVMAIRLGALTIRGAPCHLS